MSVDYQGIIAALQQYNPSIAGVVVTSMMGDIIYYTPNWQPDPNEVKKVVNMWRGGNAISATLSGVKFTVLQSSSERFISTNIKKQGHLVGAQTPQGECVLAFLTPDAAYDGGYMDLARAAGQLRPGGSATGLEVTAATAGVATTSAQSALSGHSLQSTGGAVGGGGGAGAQEVQQLLQWVEDPNGLAAYINYCIQNNDMAKIQAFSRFYRALRQALG